MVVIKKYNTMGDLVIVEKVLEGATIISSALSRHPNVACQKIQGTYACEESGQDTKEGTITAACELESMQSYLELVKLGEETSRANTVRIILLQLAHAVHHIHQHKWSHGEIKIENLYVSKTRRNLVLVQPSKVYSTGHSATEEDKRKDITELSDLYESILQDSGTSDNASEDLLMSMRHDSRIKSDELLQHPYYWGTEKKLRFLCEIVQRSKEDPDHRKRLTKSLDEVSHHVFLHNKEGWFAELKIVDPNEKDKCDACLKGVTVSRHTVKQAAKHSNGYSSYQKDSLYSLLNFIRNTSEHFWNKEDEFKACFLLDPSEGCWRFFNKRFPDVLQVVYNVVKEQHFKDTRLTRIYFEAMEPNQELPVLNNVQKPTISQFQNGTEVLQNGRSVVQNIHTPDLSYAEVTKRKPSIQR